MLANSQNTVVRRKAVGRLTGLKGVPYLAFSVTAGSVAEATTYTTPGPQTKGPGLAAGKKGQKNRFRTRRMCCIAPVLAGWTTDVDGSGLKLKRRKIEHATTQGF